MPGGAGTPGGYDGGSGSSSGGGGGGGGGEGGAAQRAAAQRAQAQLDANRLNAQRAAAAVARENEARETARENAIQLAALTPKTIEPIRHHSADTPTQIAEQKEIDLYGYQDAKAKAPTTFKPKTKPITIHGKDGSYTRQVVKYSPTYYQDKSKIGGETYGERAEAGMKRGFWDSGLGTLSKGNLPTNLLDKTGLGSYFDPKKMATSFVLNKMGLGMLNPILGIMSLFGFNPNSDQRNQDFFAEKVLSSKNKEKMENLGYKGYMKQRAAGKIDAYGNEIAKGEDKNIMQASIKEFQPTRSQQDQITEVMRKRQVLLEHARTGQLNEKGENTLQQMDQLISQYQVNPESIFKV